MVSTNGIDQNRINSKIYYLYFDSVKKFSYSLHILSFKLISYLNVINNTHLN